MLSLMKRKPGVWLDKSLRRSSKWTQQILFFFRRGNVSLNKMFLLDKRSSLRV